MHTLLPGQAYGKTTAFVLAAPDRLNMYILKIWVKLPEYVLLAYTISGHLSFVGFLVLNYSLS